MDYGNKFNLFDNEDEIIKLLDDAAQCSKEHLKQIYPHMSKLNQ